MNTSRSPSPSTTLATLTAANSTTTGGGSLPLTLSNGIFENTTNGAWAEWQNTNLRNGADTVRYDKPQSRAASDSRIELHLGSKDGPKSVDIPLDYSGSGWGTVATTTVQLDPSVFTGVQDVYADFVSSTQSASQPYVANVSSRTRHALVTMASPSPASRNGLPSPLDEITAAATT